ncbi:hypothetical protein SNE40_006202 [Patella caerulea]|uniref:Ankyrin repeat protein n=1 Tax=Patella caerulea TaxID=87958 RepID=A0AAN8JZW2_PATCE
MFCSMSNINPISKLKFLSFKGLSLHTVDKNNMSLLQVSCQRGTVETVEYLVNEIGLDVNHNDNYGSTPALYCSMSNINPISKLKFLSFKGVSLHTVDNKNRSLLHASCQMSTIETVEYLVNEILLDVNHKDNNGLTPAVLCSTSNINPISKLKFLSFKGASLHAVYNNNMSLLHASCRMGTVETVEYLVNEIGLDANHKDNNGATPAMYCSNIDPISKLKFLSSKGTSLHSVDNNNKTLLHVSCQWGTVETVEYLVNDIGLDVSHKDIEGICCCVTNLDPVKKINFLSSKGASLINMNLLGISCLGGTIETVEYLVNEIGLDVNQSYDNDIPLLCCFNSKIQKLEKTSFLISNGAMIIICRPYKDFFRDEDDSGKCSYPLHHSCYLGTLDTVKVLVNDAGYDVNYTGDDKMTALLWCFKTWIQQQEKIRLLIFKGAVITICRPYKYFFNNIL